MQNHLKMTIWNFAGIAPLYFICFCNGCNDIFLTPLGHTPIVLTFIKINELSVNDHKIMQNLKFENSPTFPLHYICFCDGCNDVFLTPPGHTPICQYWQPHQKSKYSLKCFIFAAHANTKDELQKKYSKSFPLARLLGHGKRCANHVFIFLCIRKQQKSHTVE